VKKKIKGLLAKIKGQGGFTLIELIIVIAIMGFLVAMIAPRLAQVGAGASVAVCDTNQQRLNQVLGAYTEQHGQLPNNLTNLVSHNNLGVPADPRGAAAGWYVDNNDREDGKEVLSRDKMAMVHLRLHALNAAEAEELRGLGISRVFNLNANQGAVDGINTGAPLAAASSPYMQGVSVGAGVNVLMIGAGYDGTAWSHDLTANTAWGNPDLAYRIVLGVGPDSELVARKLIQSAALCPAGMQRADHFAYNNYSLVVPRLEATMARVLPVPSINATHDNGQTKALTFAGEEVWQFTTVCPEGCQLMDDDTPAWTIN